MTVKRQDRSVKEISVEKELVRRVHAMGGLAPKTTVIGYRGFFDRLLVLPGGRIIFVEVKRPKGGKMSAPQQLLHNTYKNLGARVEIVSSSEDIARLFEKE